MTKGGVVHKIIIITLLAILSSCGFINGDEKINLIIACKEGDLLKVRSLLERIESPNYISMKGDTPLNTAIYNKHLNVIKLLLASGASCSLKDEAGENPLNIAKKVGDSAILEYLESSGGCI